MRIEERLRESVARYGAHPAIVAQRICHSYAELDLKSERLAAALQSGGVARGSRVAIFMDDGWEAVVSIFAALKAGAIVMPVGAGTVASVLGEALHKGQPVAVITQSRLAAMVAAAIASVWSVRLVVLVGGDRARAGATCISFEETVERIGRTPRLAAVGDDSDAAVQFADEAPLTHRQIGEAAAGAAIGDETIPLPALAECAGFVRMLSALDAGRTMTARAASARAVGGEHRVAALRPGESSFGMSGLLDAATAGAMPVFQR